jgi:hypothetical protein
MTECLVNDVPIGAEIRPETWGDLLGALDRSLGRERRVVTAVRFDGVDEPSFRAPALIGRRLEAVSRVDVDAVEAGRLLEDALSAAADSLPSLASATRLAADAYRDGAADAHGQLRALVAAVQSLVALTAAAATAATAVRGGPTAAGDRVAASSRRTEAALTTLIDRHTRADWPALADALEHDLAPSILAWQQGLDAIREEAGA